MLSAHLKNERREGHRQNGHRHPDGLHRRHLASRTSHEGVIVPAISKNHSVSLSLVSFVPCFAVKGFVFPSSLATAFCSIDEDSPTVPGCWPMEGVGDGCCGRSRSTDGGLSIGGSTRAAERSTGVPAVGDSTASGPYGGLHANRRQAVTTTGSPLRLGGPSGRARKCGPTPAASCRGWLPRPWLARRAIGPLPCGQCTPRPLVRC